MCACVSCLVPSYCEAEDAVYILWVPCFVMLKMLCVMSGSHFFVLLKMVCVLSGSHFFCEAEGAVCIVWLFSFFVKT